MKSNKYTNIEDKYYLGNTTIEEEVWLKDHSNDTLFEVLKTEKKESMDWDFEKFLEKAEPDQSAHIRPIKKTQHQKFFLVAASLVLICGILILFKMKSSQSSVSKTSQMVQKEVQKQKTQFNIENNLASNKLSDSVNTQSPISADSLKEDEHSAHILDQILPKRGRIKRQVKSQLVQSDVKLLDQSEKPNKELKEASTENDQGNYVTINGQKIENEDEAIDVAKYSFRILSEQMTKTVAQAHTIETFDIE